MQAYQSTMPIIFANAALVEFPYVKPQYPIGQSVTVHFMAPHSFFAGTVPQVGNDWIGIYPLGWTSLSQFVTKKMVKTEFFGRYASIGYQHAEVEFEPEFSTVIAPGQLFQFVYVKNGQCAFGASKPFGFVSTGGFIDTFTLGKDELYTPSGKQFDWMTSAIMSEKPLKSVIGDIHEMFEEHVRLESVNRYLDQLAIFAQLKSYEHHILGFLKQEQAIKEFVRTQRVDAFAQKVYELVKISPSRVAQSPEFYIRKYEQMVMDKIGMRVRFFEQLRQTIFETESKLKELQIAEAQFYKQFALTFKSKFAEFESAIGGTPFSSPTAHWKLREHFKYITSSLWSEMSATKLGFYTAQQHIMHFVTSVHAQLTAACTPEWTEIYAKFAIPTATFYGSYYYSYGTYYKATVSPAEYRQLEVCQHTIGSLKYKLAMQHGQAGTSMPSSFDYDFIKVILKAIGEFESGVLSYEKTVFLTHLPAYATWFGERMDKIYKYKQYFEGALSAEKPSLVYGGEYELPMLLWKVREFEAELVQLIHFFKVTTAASAKPYPGKLIQLVKSLQAVLGEKSGNMSAVYDRMPVEYVLVSGRFEAWKEILENEKKAVALKASLVVKEQFRQLYARLFDIERFAGFKQFTSYAEKLQYIRNMFDMPQLSTKFGSFFPIQSYKTFESFFYFQEMFFQLFKTIHETETALWLSTSLSTSTKPELVFGRLLGCSPLKYFQGLTGPNRIAYGPSYSTEMLPTTYPSYETYGLGDGLSTTYPPTFTSLITPSYYTNQYTTSSVLDDLHYPTKSKSMFYETPSFTFPYYEKPEKYAFDKEVYPTKSFYEYEPEISSLFSGFDALSMNDSLSLGAEPIKFGKTYGLVGSFDSMELITDFDFESFKAGKFALTPSYEF